MKAKVLKTGNIIDVEFSHQSMSGVLFYEDTKATRNGKRVFYRPSDLMFLDNDISGSMIDWEQRRFELIKAVLPSAMMISNTLEKYSSIQELVSSIHKGEVSKDDMEEYANLQIRSAVGSAIQYADAVIAKPKDESV